MSHENSERRWSTPAFVGISIALSALAFVGGRMTASCSNGQPEKTAPVAFAPSSDAGTGSNSTSFATSTYSKAHTSAGAAFSDERWQRLASVRRTPVAEKEMMAYLEELATHDPQRAMALATAEKNDRLNQALRGAVLRGWASVSPDEAAAWALARPVGEKQAAMEVVLAGAARQPELALKLGRRLCQNDPVLASDYGQFLVHGLTELGAYDAAARFAAENKIGNQGGLLNLAYTEWASHDPEQALAAFGSISDPLARSAAFQGVIMGWIMANPAATAAYGATMPPGEDRMQVISQALPQWASRDPLAASEWMLKTIQPGPDMDSGAASVAVMPNLVSQRPEIAVNWAENIAEPLLRTNTLRVIAQQWVERDAAGLRRYIETNTNLAPADRAALQEGLALH